MRPTRDARNDEHHEEPDAASGAEEERINDPLTRTGVESPELPSEPSSPLASNIGPVPPDPTC